MSSNLPSPTALPSVLRDEELVDSQRNLFCPNYDACLHLVVKRGWAGWSCLHCPLRNCRVGEPRAKDFAQARPRSFEVL